MAEIDLEALAAEDLRDDVALAINRAWNDQGEVPFPLYQNEAEALADAALKVIRARLMEGEGE